MSNQASTPMNPNVLPFRVGIAPAATATAIPASAPQILGVNGNPITSASVPAELVDSTGETLNTLTWDAFLAWRKTKCRPFANEGTQFALNPGAITGNEESESARRRALEEMDQAILEFIGEVAELGELFNANGPTTFLGNLRDKLIDECGDILFCGMWALDAWSDNPLYGVQDLELIRVTDDDALAMFAQAVSPANFAEAFADANFLQALNTTILAFMLGIQTNAGLLANSFKKLRYQRRAQEVKTQVSRIANVLLSVNQILIIANSSIEEALKVNMKKLDARFPKGYQSGVGGGIRTGEGK